MSWKRNTKDTWLWGVLGGFSVMTNTPALLWRLLFILCFIPTPFVWAHGPGGLFLYCLFAFFLPLDTDH